MQRIIGMGHHMNGSSVLSPMSRQVPATAFRLAILCTLLSLIVLPGLAQQPPDGTQIWDFDTLPPGTIPSTFQVGTFFDGRPAGEWKVIISDRAKSPGQLLAQVQPKGSDQTHKVLLIEGTGSSDVEIEVSYLAVSGKANLGGGLVWRAADDRNYYVLRSSSTERKVRLYRMTKGIQQLVKSIDRNIPSSGWHTLRVVHKGCEILAFFDGEPIIRACDSSLTTGRIGVWTNADAVTYFDDLRLRRLN
jgi:hypothetical protein